MTSMLNAVRYFFSPPVFPSDESKTRLARILYTLVITLLIVIALGQIAVLFIYVQKGLTTIILLVALGLLLTLNVLLKRGHLRIGGLLYVFVLWSVATLFLYIGSGASSPALGFYIALTVTAGILLSVRWAVVLAILNILVVLGVALLEINSYPFPHLIPEPPLTRWFNFSINLFITVMPIYLILTSLSEALTRAQQEISQRKKAELLLRESERKFRDIANNIPGMVFQFCVPHNAPAYFTYVSPHGAELFDFTGDLNAPDWELGTNVHPEDKAAFLASINQAATGHSNWSYEGRFLNSQGDIMWAQGIASPTATDEGLVFDGVLFDITGRKNLEAQILQSQKMEALGRLAGGIAHDFNNMLTPILGYVELGMMKLSADSKLHANLLEIKKAAERASGLTRQILAFSRHQVLEISVLNLNAVIEDVQKMLKRVIGEDIELQTLLSPDLYRVKADKGQLEQVLVNLTINARDAMPQGGKLIIETMNAFLDETVVDQYTEVQITGPYVMLAVSDTGHGMDEETRKRLFEPFFTTKEAGKGTGLGLATVLGIIKQHLGYIFVYSEPDKGTSLKIYLPSTEEAIQGQRPEVSDINSFYGHETVLVVEDEAMVRQLACEILSTYGYRVLEASSPEESLRQVADYEETIDLLLTDVIMPKMNGLELYQKLAVIRPDLKVLYMSGYTDNVIFQEHILNQRVTLLQKPFTTQNFVQKVRQVLG